MYASVTDIIPNMDDQAKISGRILCLNLYSFLLYFLFPLLLLYLNFNQLQILWIEINGWYRSLNWTRLRCLHLIHATAFGIWLIPHSTRHQLHCELAAYDSFFLLSSLHGIKIECLFCCICMFKGLISEVLCRLW